MTVEATKLENELVGNKENKSKRRRTRKTKRISDNFVFHFEVNKKKLLKSIITIVVFFLSIAYFRNTVLPNDIPIYVISTSITTLFLGIILIK
jgi:hypothetical protein